MFMKHKCPWRQQGLNCLRSVKVMAKVKDKKILCNRKTQRQKAQKLFQEHKKVHVGQRSYLLLLVIRSVTDVLQVHSLFVKFVGGELGHMQSLFSQY